MLETITLNYNEMKKSILGLFGGIAILFSISSFIICDPKADFLQQSVGSNDQIFLSEITTKNSTLGSFKSSLKIQPNLYENSAKEFYGLRLTVHGNPKVDRILIGITNNLISRIEIWNQDELVETKELGFMGKMTWGETHSLTVDFFDQTNEKYKGKSKISMRFFSGTGFFGDIGTINFDLTKYGEFDGEKSISVFAKSMDTLVVNNPEFSELRIWKNFKSFD